MAIKGQDRHLQRLKRMSGGGTAQAADQVMLAGAERVRSRARREIARAAISDEHPKRDGGLQASIATSKSAQLVAEVTASAPYAAALEFGTSKMAAQPYMRPSRDAEVPAIRRMFAEEIGKVIKRSGQ